MTTDYLADIQRVTLEMGSFFAGFCRENGLLCYMCGGGCIGAVRSGGFIPWDDDLDFFMPRADYERLKEIWPGHDRYVLAFPSETYNDHNMFMTLRDTETTMIRPYQQDMDIVHGLALDIFPLDGCPSSRLRRVGQIMWGYVYQLYCAQLVPENHGGLVSLAARVMLGAVRSPRARFRIWRMAERQMSRYEIRDCDYITEICAGPRYMKNMYPAKAFREAILVPFEDAEMPVPAGYDAYLRMAFGDYMSLPPEEDRVPSHDAVITDTHNPYTVYRNIYYGQTDRTE